MAIFTKSGDEEEHFWLVNGSPNFSVMPANTISIFQEDLPIRLHVGNMSYGQIHTEKHWTIKTAGNRTIPELIHFKLGQSGAIYCTEKNSKIKITMGIAPGGLMLMEYRFRNVGNQKENYLSVTTFYGPMRRAPDGQPIGRYQGRPLPRLMPLIPISSVLDEASNEDVEIASTGTK